MDLKSENRFLAMFRFGRTSIVALAAAGALAACSGQETATPNTSLRSADPATMLEPQEFASQSDSDESANNQRFQLSPATRPTPASYETRETKFRNTEPVAVFDLVKSLAKSRSERAYEPPKDGPQFLKDIDYDEYRQIMQRDEYALFANNALPFRVGLDSRGYLFNQPITVNVVDETNVDRVEFNPDEFRFGTSDLTDDQKAQLGLAGFRLLSPLNQAGKFDEVLSVKGTSFFRALGAGNRYGVSARGLSIRTAAPEGEEFPAFREFWIQEPKVFDGSFVFHALLDSPSLTGAYQFRVTPGTNTIIDVEAEIFARSTVNRIGISPVTSMFQFAPHDRDSDADDFRTRVHDSEGLSARLANGEWVWRPLSNPRKLQVSSFASRAPQGFGLMQRNRNFEEFQDIEARYEDRPSVWVTPGEGWDNGDLMLIEIPTPNEYHDNIIALWQLEDALQPGDSYRFSYRLNWSQNPPFNSPMAPVISTRSGLSESTGRRLFVIDFAVNHPAGLDDVEPVVSASSGRIYNVTLTPDLKNNRARLSFELEPESTQTAELRAQLTRISDPVSETWLYRWTAG